MGFHRNDFHPCLLRTRLVVRIGTNSGNLLAIPARKVIKRKPKKYIGVLMYGAGQRSREPMT
jgi:hypothetical protein